ncbi:MAG: ferritin [Candidatus Parabeggiatoa sp. nov. 2]|nr:MAG: ferritin [Beggiatoa sp. 4572_84]RKZ46080.1 MAG: ferritin [Gammaproteobacteria bacterium]
MIGKNIAEELNKQVNREFYSAYFYLSMSAYSDFLGLKGFASWFLMKNQEETQHAMRVYKYILDQGAQIALLPIKQPPSTFDSPLAMFEETLAHEQAVTQRFNELVDIAMAEKDHATHIFLQWFITEQIEEEATVSEIINKIKLVGGKGDGLFMIDNQLGQLASTQSVAAV